MRRRGWREGAGRKGYRKRERARQREEDGGRGGEARIRMNILHFGAKIPQRVGKTML